MYLRLGQALSYQGKLDQANGNFAKALLRDPKLSYLPILNGADLLQSQGKLDEAIEKYQKVTELAPKFYLASRFGPTRSNNKANRTKLRMCSGKASEVDPTIHRK